MTDAPAVIINLPGRPYDGLPVYASVAAIRAIPSGTLKNAQMIVLDSADIIRDGIFSYAPASVAVDDGVSVIKPNDLTALQAGRWLTSLSLAIPKGDKGDPGGNAEAIGTYAQALVGSFVLTGISRVSVNGTTTAGDAGAGRQFAYNSAVDASYVAANPGIAFLDASGRGFLEIRPSTVVQGPTYKVAVDNGYDATQDILAARRKSTYTGDDAPAINAVATTQRAFCYNPEVGYIDARTQINLPLAGARIVKLGSRQQAPIVRHPMHTGNSIQIGSLTVPCGSAHLENLFFNHAGRIGYGSTQPIGSLPGVLLKNDQAHMYMIAGQAAKVINCGGWGAAHMLRVADTSGLLVDHMFTFGGVWDPDYVNAQEAVSIISLSSAGNAGRNAEVVVQNSQLYGSSVPDRVVTIGDKTVTAPRRAGPLAGVLVNSCENWRIDKTLIASMSDSGAKWAPDSARAYNVNGSILGSAIDESNLDCISVFRGDASYTLPNTLTVQGCTINGQLVARNACTIYNGPGGLTSLQTLNWTGNTARAFLGAGIRLFGATQAQIRDGSIAGYNIAYSESLEQSCGVLVGGTTTDVDIANFRFGGGINTEADSATPNANGLSSNGCKYGVYRAANVSAVRGSRLQKGAFGKTGGAFLARQNNDGSYTFSNGEATTPPIFDPSTYVGA